MRTTVTLDPDVAAMVQQLMRERGLTFKEAVNQAIRRGLGTGRGAPSFPTYRLGKPNFEIDRALHVAAELEDEELARKLERRK